MDRAIVLERLGLGEQDWGVGVNAATHADFAAGWRGAVPVPTQQTMDAEWAEIAGLGGIAGIQKLSFRTLAKTLINSDTSALIKLLRAVIAFLIDEVNILRGQIIGVGTAVWDPNNIANGAGLTSPNLTVAGAAFGDFVKVAAPYTLQGLTATGYVSAANTVNVRLENQTGGAVNLTSGVWKVEVERLVVLPDRDLTQAKKAIGVKLDSGTVD